MTEPVLNIKKWDKPSSSYINVQVKAEIQKKKIFGKTIFFHESIDGDDGTIVMSEYETGGKICSGNSKGACRLKLLDIINRVGRESFIQTIDDSKRKHGIANIF